MNNKKLKKEEILKKIKEVFSKESISKKDIRKIKRLAMSKNIKLRDLRKKFCKKCYSFFNSFNSEIRINKGFKVIKCKECGFINRWKMKSD